MSAESIQQGNLLGRSARPGAKSCPDCGEIGRALYIPHNLPYEQAKAYKGKRVCAGCAPRFNELPSTDFGVTL